MILRRITEHVRAQNWFAVGLDLGIVVVGVFIGIEVQQWADAQRQGRLERTYIERLQAEVLNLLKNTKSQVDYLHGNQWIGRGSDKFFAEMEQRYLPALQKLANALGTGAEKAQKVIDTIRQADEGTKALFTRLQ